MSKYDLVGVDSNAFSILAYVRTALRKEGLKHLVQEYEQKATIADYDNLIVVSMDYIDLANEKAIENGYNEDEE